MPGLDMTTEYRALVDKVEGFTRVVLERRSADIACRAGCSSCCETWLSVSAVEAAELCAGLDALSADARAAVAERGRLEQAREASDPDGASSIARCAMLEPDGRCAVYEHRPLVCRTQGHALRYPAGFIPEAAVRARTSGGDIAHCPLNFTHAAPRGEDVLDAERVDEILSIVGRRFALAHDTDGDARFALSELAARG
jgi:Fe-S-cluster containining protein